MTLLARRKLLLLVAVQRLLLKYNINYSEINPFHNRSKVIHVKWKAWPEYPEANSQHFRALWLSVWMKLEGITTSYMLLGLLLHFIWFDTVHSDRSVNIYRCGRRNFLRRMTKNLNSSDQKWVQCNDLIHIPLTCISLPPTDASHVVCSDLLSQAVCFHCRIFSWTHVCVCPREV